MSDITPAFDLGTDTVVELLDFAERVEGTLSVTREGRLIVYGVDGAPAIVEHDRFEPPFYIEALDDTTLAFKF